MQPTLEQLKAQLAESEATLKSLVSAAKDCQAKGESASHFGMVIELQDAECGELQSNIRNLEYLEAKR